MILRQTNFRSKNVG